MNDIITFWFNIFSSLITISCPLKWVIVFSWIPGRVWNSFKYFSCGWKRPDARISTHLLLQGNVLSFVGNWRRRDLTSVRAKPFEIVTTSGSAAAGRQRRSFHLDAARPCFNKTLCEVKAGKRPSNISGNSKYLERTSTFFYSLQNQIKICVLFL